MTIIKDSWQFENMEKIDGCKVIRVRLSRMGEGWSLWAGTRYPIALRFGSREDAEKYAREVEKAVRA